MQRAIDLSEYYKDNILRYAPAISYIFDEIGVSPILNKLRLNQLKNFDKNELEELLSPSDIEILKNSQFTNKFYEEVGIQYTECPLLVNKDNDIMITVSIIVQEKRLNSKLGRCLSL